MLPNFPDYIGSPLIKTEMPINPTLNTQSMRPICKKSDIRVESVRFTPKVHAYMHIHTSKVDLKFTCVCFKVNIGLVV